MHLWFRFISSHKANLWNIIFALNSFHGPTQRNTIFAGSLQSWVNFSPQASFAVVINALRVCSITLLQYIAFIKFGTSCTVLILCMTWQIFLIYKPTSVWMSDYLMKKIEKDWMLPLNQSLDILDTCPSSLGWSHTNVLSSEVAKIQRELISVKAFKI